MARHLDFLIAAFRRRRSHQDGVSRGGPPAELAGERGRREPLEELETLIAARTAELQHAKSALEASRRRLSFALESAGESLWEWDVDSDDVVLGQAAPALLGATSRLLSFDRFLALVEAEDRPAVEAALSRLVDGEQERLATEFRVVTPAGEMRWLSCRAGLVEHATADSQRRVVGMLGDITARKAMELQLAASEERLSLALESMSAGIVELDLPSGEVGLSSCAAAMLGFAPGFWPSNLEALMERIHPDDRSSLAGSLERLREGREQNLLLEVRAQPQDDAVTWISLALKAVEPNQGGLPRRLVGIVLDVSARKEAEDKLAHLAMHDPLTGLANRARFAMALDGAVRQVKSAGGRLLALMIDLDRLKAVNDTFGHAIGDRLIVEAGRRLLACVRNDDLVARLGGDEFAILMRDVEGRLDPAELAARILERFDVPFTVDGHRIRSGASVGVALFPEHATSADGLLACADKALYAAKGAGRQTWRIHRRPGERGGVPHEGPMDARLEKALEHGELELHFQPILAISGLRPVGVEALLRWRHPARGLLSASAFIPQIEHRPFMMPLTRWTVETALGELEAWRAQGRRDLPVWVNVAPRCLGWKGLVPLVAQALDQHALPPDQLVLEITEGALADIDKAAATTGRLRELGVGVALDDFGAGFSSLARLKTLPLSVLKIDRGFVEHLVEDRRDSAIVGTVVALAESLGARVLAEGVETRGQLGELERLGCDLAQGHLFAQAMPAPAMLRWLAETDTRQRPLAC